MATLTRRSDYSLESQLYNQTYEFEFSQAVRILEALKPGCDPFGETENPGNEAMQVKSRLTLSVSSSDLYSLKPPQGFDNRPILTVNFLGIAGIQGPLPMPYTEMILDRLRHKDTSSRDFLDIFNHRLVGMWYRIQKKFVLGIDQISPEATVAGKTFLDLLGLNSHYLRHKLKVTDRSLLGFTPLFWQRNRSTAGLHQLLKNYFKTEIRIEEFQGKWRKAISEDWSLIGQTGQYNALGKTAVLGKKSWDQTAGIKIFLKELKWKDYLTHLPGQHGHATISSLTQFYAGVEKTFTFWAAVNQKEIPPSILKAGFRLGQTTWITRGKGKGFTKSPVVKLSHEALITEEPHIHTHIKKDHAKKG